MSTYRTNAALLEARIVDFANEVLLLVRTHSRNSDALAWALCEYAIEDARALIACREETGP